jgi:dTDP-4-dehydrorhamnose reductase
MRLLVVGRTGQVGWELCRALAPLGEVIALSRADLDLGDADAIRTAIRRVRPDILLNAAAFTSVDAAETAEQEAYAVNAEAPAVMAGALRQSGGSLIHYSTDYVFDGTKDGAYREDDAPNPLGAYGRTKLAGEEAVRASGAAHIILRTSWVYGLRGRNFLLTMLRLSRQQDRLRIVDDQFGAPTWSRHIAVATALVIARGGLKLATLRATYHLSSRGSCSWHGFAEAIMQRWRGGSAPAIEAISTEAFGAAAPRPRNSRLDCGRIAADFGIALPDWRAVLDSVYEESGTTVIPSG